MTFHQAMYYVSSKGNFDRIHEINFAQKDGSLLYTIVPSVFGWSLFRSNGLLVISGGYSLPQIIKIMFGLGNADCIAGMYAKYKP